MKKSFFYAIAFLGSTFLFSCEAIKTKELVSDSPDKTGQIKVSGTKGTSLDPFQTSIIINGYDQTDTLMTEIYAQDLTNENVQFVWTGGTCALTFIQQDDSRRTIEINFSEGKNSYREISN